MYRPSVSLISSLMIDRFPSSWRSAQDAVKASGLQKSGAQREITSLLLIFPALISSSRWERPQISEKLLLK